RRRMPIVVARLQRVDERREIVSERGEVSGSAERHDHSEGGEDQIRVLSLKVCVEIAKVQRSEGLNQLSHSPGQIATGELALRLPGGEGRLQVRKELHSFGEGVADKDDAFAGAELQRLLLGGQRQSGGDQQRGCQGEVAKDTHGWGWDGGWSGNGKNKE